MYGRHSRSRAEKKRTWKTTITAACQKYERADRVRDVRTARARGVDQFTNIRMHTRTLFGGRFYGKRTTVVTFEKLSCGRPDVQLELQIIVRSRTSTGKSNQTRKCLYIYIVRFSIAFLLDARIVSDESSYSTGNIVLCSRPCDFTRQDHRLRNRRIVYLFSTLKSEMPDHT